MNHLKVYLTRTINLIRPNYYHVYVMVKEIIELYKLNTIPINLNDIIYKTKNLRICPYSQFAHNKCTIQEVIDFFGSELGAYACTRDRSKCVIYYNDTKKNIGLERFTIAHELGHHFLGHYRYMLDGNILLRGLSNPDYSAIEKEANCFARNLLSPIYLIHSIGIIANDTEKIKDIFNISLSAAKTRTESYTLDLKSRIDGFQEFFERQFEKALNLLTKLSKCNVCGYYFSRYTTKYCPICGNDDAKNIFIEYGGIKPMIYPGLETENGKVKECPVCKNEQLQLGEYCPICGTHIVNRCSNEHCGALQEGYARYCVHCGCKTTFYENKLLDSWQDAQNKIHNDNYPLNKVIKDYDSIVNETDDYTDDLPF